MDYYNIDLSPTRTVNPFNVQGKAFYYVDAAAAGGVDTRITVTPAGQPAITLKPGQSFRLQEAVNSWQVVNADSGATFAGNIIIGSGNFDDNNATINGVVTVAIQGTPTVNLSAGSKVQEEILTYTGIYAENVALIANVAKQIVAPGANVNGILVQLTGLIPDNSAGYDQSFLAKATVPASVFDGDVIDVQIGAAAATPIMNNSNTKIKIPAGKGLFYIQSQPIGRLRKLIYVVL
jgi:hypothetical protein